MDKIIPVFALLFILLVVTGLFVDFKHYNEVNSATTNEELKAACLDKWYRTSEISKMPAGCIKFYANN